MKRLIIRMLNEKSIVISIISILFSILGLYGICITALNAKMVNNIELIVYIIVSIVIGILLIVKSVYMEIVSIKTIEKRIICGIGIGNSEYNITNMLKNKPNEVIIVAQNMGTLAMTDKFIESIISAINENTMKVKIFLVPYLTLRGIDQKYGDDLKYTIERLIYVLKNVNNGKKNNLIIRFNDNALSLSSIFIDPSDYEKGLAIFIPKSSFKDPPNNRVYCVVKKSENSDIFQNIYGSVNEMLLSNSTKLFNEIVEMKKDGHTFRFIRNI